MKIVFEPSGTHVKDDKLKVRLDVYPDVTDKTHTLHYVEKFDDSGNSLGRALNPCLCHFIEVPEDITREQLLAHVAQLFTPDCLATLDDALMRPDAAHRISPYMRGRPRMVLRQAQDKLSRAENPEELIAAVNARLSGMKIQGESGGKAEIIEPQSIYVGAAAIDRVAYIDSQTTVNFASPSASSGTLDTVGIWAASTLSNCEVATFYVVSGNNLSTRDYEAIGSVNSGSEQIFTGKSIDVVTEDYIGIYYTAGWIEKDSTGSGIWGKSNDNIPCTNAAFNFTSSRTISLYSTGSDTTNKSEADTGAGADAVASIEMAATEADSGAGAEGYSLDTGGTPTAADSGAGAEAIASREITASDTGAGGDAESLITASLTKAESGGGDDGLTIYESCLRDFTTSTVLGGTTWIAQTFTPQTAHDIYAVSLPLKSQGTPGTVTVSIRATDGNGYPTGGDLCSGTTDGNSLPGLYFEWRAIVFSSPYHLMTGTKYAIVVRCANDLSLAWGNWASDIYAGGEQVWSANSGSSWGGNGSGWDDGFKEGPAAFSISAEASVADSGAGAEGYSLDAGATQKTGADSGAGADAFNDISGTLTESDAGQGAEAITSREITASDSGAGAEAITNREIVLNDSGAGAEGYSLDAGATPKTAADSGTGADVMAQAEAILAKADAGAGADAAATVTASITTGESGGGVEGLVLAAAKTVADTGAGHETASVVKGMRIIPAVISFNKRNLTAKQPGLNIKVKI